MVNQIQISCFHKCPDWMVQKEWWGSKSIFTQVISSSYQLAPNCLRSWDTTNKIVLADNYWQIRWAGVVPQNQEKTQHHPHPPHFIISFSFLIPLMMDVGWVLSALYYITHHMLWSNANSSSAYRLKQNSGVSSRAEVPWLIHASYSSGNRSMDKNLTNCQECNFFTANHFSRNI